jgi:hypothetical protein
MQAIPHVQKPFPKLKPNLIRKKKNQIQASCPFLSFYYPVLKLPKESSQHSTMQKLIKLQTPEQHH